MRRAVTFDAATWERLQRAAAATDTAEVTLAADIVSNFMRQCDRRRPVEQRTVAREAGQGLAELISERAEWPGAEEDAEP